MESVISTSFATAVRAALESAVRCHEAGDTTEAERFYEQVLRVDPANSEALHGSGLLALQVGNFGLARQRFGRAIEAGIDLAGTVYLYGRACRGAGDYETAIDAYRAALVAVPRLVEAHIALALALKDAGRLDEAEAGYRAALAVAPDSFEARVNLANLLQLQGRFDEAAAEYLAAEELAPDSASVHYNLGKMLRLQGRHAEAVERFQRTVMLDAGWLEAYFNLGNAFASLGQHGAAIDCFDHLCRLIESGAGRPTDATARERLLRETWTAVIAPLAWSQRFDEALPLLSEALAREPDSRLLNEYRLLILPYRCESRSEVIEAYRGYQALLPTVEPLAMAARPSAASRRRIGYLSGDFRDHSVSSFIEPLLEHHDRLAFEVFCYSTNAADDVVTDRLRRHADVWRDVAVLDDAALARQIAEDGIDILIDLSGRTTRNRLGVFALRPAPVQIGYLGYPTYTGIPEIDWRITDAVIDPPGMPGLPAERPLRLSRSPFCYRPPAEAGEEGDVPAAERSHVCFSSFNQVQKLSPTIISAWARILDAVPGSRLLLKALGFNDPATRQRMLSAFASVGVDDERIFLNEPTSTRAEHLALYRAVDVALDTYPYNGTTTTCEALWMGVPVVTLAGETHASRVGASLLGALGAAEWVAHSVDAYVETAVRLACDPDALGHFRRGLRQRFADSPLRDEAGFVRAFEQSLTNVLHS